MTRFDLEAEELEQVEEFRSRLKGLIEPEMYNDTSLLIRFLRARNHNFAASEDMLLNHINWKKQNKIDKIFIWYTPHEVSDNYLPFSHTCFDKEGAPVIYIDLGNIDSRGLLKSISIPEFLNYCINFLEKITAVLKSQSSKLNTVIEQWILVFNFENFSLATATHKPTIDAFIKIVAIYESNYPERLKSAIVLNASWYFHIALALVKPFISGPTFQKIKIFGKDGWKEELLNRVDADYLPAFLGGKCTDPDGDPKCKMHVKHGMPVPEKYFAINNRTNFISQLGVRKLEVGRLSKSRIELLVLYPNSNIEWEFELKERDVAFCLLYKDSQSSPQEAKEVVPKQRVNTSISSECGVFKCEKPGTYFLEFDNRYSWIYQKEVYYKVQVKAPHEVTVAA